MGPILLLDKSSFQALSRDELRTFRAHFLEVLTPVLVHEIVADLAKEKIGETFPEDKVAELAAKFGGSGPATTWDYRSMCLSSLVGNEVPMDGSIPARTALQVPDPQGKGYGIFIDLAPENHALMRWARGEFRDDEKAAAAKWREESKELSIAPLEQVLLTNHVVLPRSTNVEESVRAADQLLSVSSLQTVWIDWILEALEVSPEWRQAVDWRWRARPRYLSQFAPYAHYCARALLTFAISRHFHLVTERPTDLLDMRSEQCLRGEFSFERRDYLLGTWGFL